MFRYLICSLVPRPMDLNLGNMYRPRSHNCVDQPAIRLASWFSWRRFDLHISHNLLCFHHSYRTE